MRIKRIIAFILAIVVQQYIYCCAADVNLTESYYLLKYEYEEFVTPLKLAGATESELLAFFSSLESELRAVDGLTRENFEEHLKDKLLLVATYAEHSKVASVVWESYGAEIKEYNNTNVIPTRLLGVYNALVKVLFDGEKSKLTLVQTYEEYYKVYKAGMSDYTSSSVEAFKESLDDALAVLKTKEAEAQAIAEAETKLKIAYNGLEKKPSSGGGSSGGGGGGIRLPSDEDKNDVLKPEELPQEKPEEKPEVQPEEKELYTDVPKEHWSYEAVSYMTKAGIINGFGDSSFRPEQLVTREEFAKMVCVALKLNRTERFKNFTDASPDGWYDEYLQSISAYGIMVGNDDGSFGIGKTLSRQELAVTALRIVKSGLLDKSFSKLEESGEFDDLSDASAYARASISEIKDLGIVNGMGNNRFAPMESVTRAQAAQIIYGLIK